MVGGQDGTTVTAMLSYMLKNKIITAAVVTKKKAINDWTPISTIVTDADELSLTKGSIYAHYKHWPLIEAIKQGHKKIAVVERLVILKQFLNAADEVYYPKLPP